MMSMFLWISCSSMFVINTEIVNLKNLLVKFLELMLYTAKMRAQDCSSGHTCPVLLLVMTCLCVTINSR